MSMCDYFLTDTVVVDYDSGSETMSQVRIKRSLHPRWVKGRGAGQTVKEWIEENEELMSRVIYEEGVWHVKTYDSLLYMEELGELNIHIAYVSKISRVIDYTMNESRTQSVQ